MSIRRLPNWQIPNIPLSMDDTEAVRELVDWARIHHIEHDEESANVALDFEELVVGTIYPTNVESTTITTTNVNVSGSITLSGTTASRLLATDAGNIAVSTDLNSWVAGTSNQVNVAGETNGTITLSLPQNIHASASPTFITAKLSGLTDGYVPYHVADATGLANSDIHYDGTNVSIFKDATSGENPSLSVHGYVTAGTDARYSSLLMDDTNDEFLIQSENNANHEGITIDLTETNQKFRVRQNSKYLSINHDGTDVYFKTDDGSFIFQTDEGGDANTVVEIKQKAGSAAAAALAVYDQDGTNKGSFWQQGGSTNLESAIGDPLRLNPNNNQNVLFFEGSTGGTPIVQIYGPTASDTTRIDMYVAADGDGNINLNGLTTNELHVGRGGTGIMSFGLEGGGTNNYARMQSNYSMTFGSNLDYGIVYYSTGDKLQFVDGHIVNTNVRADMDSAGLFTFYESIALKTTGEIRFYDADNSHYVGFEASALSADQIWVLPNADGSQNELMFTDGSANLDFVDINSLITGTSNRIIVTDGTDGTLTLSTPQEIHTGASPTFAGFTKIGDASNYTTIESDGTIRFNGDATVWDDIRVPLTSVKTGGVKDPTFSPWKNSGSGSRGVYSWFFTDQAVAGNEEELFFNAQVPHSYKEGTDIFFHVHWTPAVSGGANEFVKWGLEYIWVDINETASANTTIIYSDATDGSTSTSSGDTTLVAGKHYKTLFSAINGSAMKVSSMLICRFFRNSSDGTDDLAQDAVVFEIDFHFEIDTIGSRLMLSK